jgi:hypothetical protein
MKKLFSTISLFILAVMSLSAQSALVGTGGEANGNGGSVSYSVGQIAVQSNSEGNTSISEGVQQPYEINVVGVDNYPGITLNAVVYPNPTQGNVQLTIDNVQFEGEVKVFDANGKFLFSRQIDGENTQLDLSPYATGTYYIIVCSGKDVMKTFKVVKTSF